MHLTHKVKWAGHPWYAKCQYLLKLSINYYKKQHTELVSLIGKYSTHASAFCFFLLLCSTFTFFPDPKLHQAARLSVISRETGRQLLYASLRDMMTSFLSPGYSRVTVAKVRVMSNVWIQSCQLKVTLRPVRAVLPLVCRSIRCVYILQYRAILTDTTKLLFFHLISAVISVFSFFVKRLKNVKHHTLCVQSHWLPKNEYLLIEGNKRLWISNIPLT